MKRTILTTTALVLSAADAGRAGRHVGQAHCAVQQLCRQQLAAGDADQLGDGDRTRREAGIVAAADAFTTAENSATEQAAQIQNMILQGYDAIVINAASPTALNGAVKEACDAGSSSSASTGS
jgi:ribose transport system substrate-binding protein